MSRPKQNEGLVMCLNLAMNHGVSIVIHVMKDRRTPGDLLTPKPTLEFEKFVTRYYTTP